MIIIGLDVGRASAVGFVLEFFPDNVKQHFSRNRQNILRLGTDEKSIDNILSIGPDAILLEPNSQL